MTQTNKDALTQYQKRIRCQNQILVVFNLFYTPMNDFEFLMLMECTRREVGVGIENFDQLQIVTSHVEPVNEVIPIMNEAMRYR